MYNIKYNGRIIYMDIDEEQMRAIMFELTEAATDGKIDLELLELIELEEI